jgi:DNA sulfur modification protein DndD
MLPFKLIEQLKTQLTKEENRRHWMAAQKTVQPNLEKLSSEMFGPSAPDPSPPLTDAQRSFLQRLLTQRWLDLFHPAPEGVTDPPLHEYLTLGEELPIVLSACVQVFQRDGFDLEPILNEIETFTRRANFLELELNGSAPPPDGDTTQLMADRDRVNRLIGKNSEARDQKSREILDARHTRAGLMSKASVLQNQMARAGELGMLADAASRIKTTIHRYQEELRPRKREQLRSHLEEMYRSLARKEGVVHSVSFDESYRITLHDVRDSVIPVDTLSAGEREIFALSLLWSLARCYGKDIPIVIDTPLGRLDSKHRSNIVKNYLPKAGTQVIILSTDTEIDKDYFLALEPYVLQTLQVTYDPVALETTVRNGYF